MDYKTPLILGLAFERCTYIFLETATFLCRIYFLGGLFFVYRVLDLVWLVVTFTFIMFSLVVHML